MIDTKGKPFKEQYTLEERKRMAEKSITEFRDRFPVIIEVDPRQTKDAKEIANYPYLK